MADFLTEQWFAGLNEALLAAGPVPLGGGVKVFRVVLEFTGAPTTLPHALTLTLTSDEASLNAGDHLAADALVRLSYADALALTTGKLDSATALREGRLKVRGDVHAIAPLLDWLQQAHPQAEP
ncbi:MAG TPA: SCP2 sterol-binding domain-containing protein [Acidimicrobiales bacterium]